MTDTEYADRLADYVEVPERMRQFFEKYPEGSLTTAPDYPKLQQPAGEGTFIVYKALAFRTPLDERPGEGMAWEPFPGTTTFTKDSELMNAETSAWGRALAAIGFVSKKIASAEEVRNRQPNGTAPETAPQAKPPAGNRPAGGSNRFATEKQQKMLFAVSKQRGLSDAEILLILTEYVGVDSFETVPMDKVDTAKTALGGAAIPDPDAKSDVPAPDEPVPDPEQKTEDSEIPF